MIIFVLCKIEKIKMIKSKDLSNILAELNISQQEIAKLTITELKNLIEKRQNETRN